MARKRAVHKYVKELKKPEAPKPRAPRKAAQTTRATFSVYPQRRALFNHKKARPTALRPSITPGTVLILLAGKYRSRRVVFLRQLKSGLLLVSGPYKINGVPLRRVDQSYVIATSAKVDISSVKVPKHVDDAYFRRPRPTKTKKSEAAFFAKQKKIKTKTSDKRKEDQKAVDTQLLVAVKATPDMVDYLRARFSLDNGQYPHNLKF